VNMLDVQQALTCARLALSLHAGRTPPPELVAHYRNLELLATGGASATEPVAGQPESELIGTSDAAAILGCSTQYVRRIAETVLEGRRIARNGWIFERKVVEDYAAHRHRRAPADPRRWQSAEPLDPASWIPVTELALEGFGRSDNFEARVTTLRHELSDEIIHDDLGRACVPRSVARVMFEERAQKQAQQQAHEAHRRAELAAQGNPLRDRVRALQQRQTLGDPLADMKRTEFEDGWERAAAQRDEVANSERSGRLQYHPIRETQE
jgi:hypothetical protein